MSEEKRGKLAVVFPGIGYHSDKPLLYYARHLAREMGYNEEVLLDYHCTVPNIRGSEEKMRMAYEQLYAQAKEQLEKIPFGEYSEILMISKSIGTVIANSYVEEYGIACKQIMYTPVAESFAFQLKDAIAFAGTEDPWIDILQIRALCGLAGIPLHIINGVNHSMEGKGIQDDIRILEEIMNETKKFLYK